MFGGVVCLIYIYNSVWYGIDIPWVYLFLGGTPIRSLSRARKERIHTTNKRMRSDTAFGKNPKYRGEQKTLAADLADVSIGRANWPGGGFFEKAPKGQLNWFDQGALMSPAITGKICSAFWGARTSLARKIRAGGFGLPQFRGPPRMAGPGPVPVGAGCQCSTFWAELWNQAKPLPQKPRRGMSVQVANQNDPAQNVCTRQPRPPLIRAN